MNPQRQIIAKDAWGDLLPDWVKVLISECDQSSQNAVATKIGMSAAVVSQVIRNSYPGNMKAVESLVRDTFMNAPVNCPALRKTISSAACLSHRRRAETWAHGDPFRVRMMRACRACPKFKPKGDE